MIRNVSYNNKEIFGEIDKLVGRSFGIKKRIKLGGTGSQRFVIRDSSSNIDELLALDTNLNYCNIELRSAGIIIRFRSILETFAWAVPYENLILNRKMGALTFSDGETYLEIEPAHNATLNISFFQKLNNLRSKDFKSN